MSKRGPGTTPAPHTTHHMLQRRKHMAATDKSSGPPAKMTRREKVVGWAIGKALFYLARKAAERNDWHEFNHIAASVNVGNSDHAKHPCSFPPELHKRAVTWAGVAAEPAGGTA